MWLVCWVIKRIFCWSILSFTFFKFASVNYMLVKSVICSENIFETGGRKAQINPNLSGWIFWVTPGQYPIGEFLKMKSEKIVEDDSPVAEVRFYLVPFSQIHVFRWGCWKEWVESKTQMGTTLSSCSHFVAFELLQPRRQATVMWLVAFSSSSCLRILLIYFCNPSL